MKEEGERVTNREKEMERCVYYTGTEKKSVQEKSDKEIAKATKLYLIDKTINFQTPQSFSTR